MKNERQEDTIGFICYKTFYSVYEIFLIVKRLFEKKL